MSMCQSFKKKLNGNKGLLITFIISLTFGIVMLKYRKNPEKITIIAAIEKMLMSFATLVILCCDNTNLSPIQEAKKIVSSVPERIIVIENLIKLVTTGKEDESQGKLVPKEEDVSQGKSVQEIGGVSQSRSVPEKERAFQGKLVSEKEGVSQGKLVSEIEVVSQGKPVPEKKGVSQVKIDVEKEGVSQCKIVAEKKCVSQGKMNGEGISTEEDRKKDSEMIFKLLSSIYDGEKKICNIIENFEKDKKINLIS